jgi:hypothetical protein
LLYSPFAWRAVIEREAQAAFDNLHNAKGIPAKILLSSLFLGAAFAIDLTSRVAAGPPQSLRCSGSLR